MKRPFWIIFVFLITGCGSGLKITEQPVINTSASFISDDFELVKNTSWFSSELRDSLIKVNYVHDYGDRLLKQILFGYSSQLEGVVYTQTDGGLEFHIKKVSVNRGLFTGDFLFVGPIYKITMDFEIFYGGQSIYEGKASEKVDVALVNFEEEKPFYIMLWNQKDDTKLQMVAFEYGLRKIYQQIYFEYFDISLVL